MKITDIKVTSFRTHADRWDMGHARPLPKTPADADCRQHRDRRRRHRLLLWRRGARRSGGPQHRRSGAAARPHPEPPRRSGPARPRDDLEMDVGRQHLGECRQRRRPDALGPRRSADQPAGLQADGRGARPGEGLRLDLPQHRGAAGLRRSRAGLQKEGYIAYKIHPHYFWNPETGTPTPAAPPTSRPISRPATWCARRSGPTTC